MGGIAAVLSASQPPDPSVLIRMLDAAPHRGTTRRVETQGRCLVGVNCREDVEDATSIATENGVTAAVCGVIDNLDELAPSLGGRDGSSPASIVLAAFRKFGDSAPDRLRGVFAGILTDGSTIRAFRDHAGFEPLFYRDEGAKLFVASEVKQILAGAGIPREPNRDVVDGMLFDNYPDQSLCALKGVRRIPQASVMHAGSNAIRFSRYWEPANLLETLRLGPHEVQERFDELMDRATARMLTGHDVITLSGGIDSPAVAAHAAPQHLKRTGRPLAALSTVYPLFPTVDERPFIELIAKELGLELHIYEPKATPFDGLQELIRLCDGPAPSAALAQTREEHVLARSLGFRTILTGEFAEYLIDVGQPHLVTHLLYKRRISALGSLLRSQRARGVGYRSIGRQLAHAIAPASVLDRYERYRYDAVYRPDWLDQAKFDRRGPSRGPSHQRWKKWQLGVLELPSWSFEADAINQAASGVRVRRPWTDIDLWEFFISLRAETKYPDIQPKKLLVRRLLRGKIPDPVLDRNQKTYFDDWLMAMIDYPFLRKLLIEPNERIAGVDYKHLAHHLRKEDLTVRDFLYIRDLTAIHAFLE